jgi:hypothetical protein
VLPLSTETSFPLLENMQTGSVPTQVSGVISPGMRRSPLSNTEVKNRMSCAFTKLCFHNMHRDLSFIPFTIHIININIFFTSRNEVLISGPRRNSIADVYSIVLYN